MSAIWRKGAIALVAAGMVGATGMPALAQDAPAPNAGSVSVSAGIDVLNAYMFRGIYQDDTRLITWPYAELGLALYDGDGGLKSVAATVGTWNSLHTGAAGSRGPSGKLWYESDFYAGIGLAFGRGMSLDTVYTAYTSPNDSFGTVHELAFQVALDDSGALGRGALQPHALVAFELDGQADGAHHKGTYLELGVAPGYEWTYAGISMPIKVGLSLRDYYELDGVDHRFGYVSVGGIATVPLRGIPARFGAWNLQGGVEFQRLGTMPRALNDDDPNKVIGLFGIGLSY